MSAIEELRIQIAKDLAHCSNLWVFHNSYDLWDEFHLLYTRSSFSYVNYNADLIDDEEIQR